MPEKESIKDVCERYAQVKNQIATLSAAVDAMKPLIISHMIEVNAEEVEIDAGKFVLSNRRKYTYSDHVDSESRRLKELKKNEERTGEADYEEAETLTFRAKT